MRIAADSGGAARLGGWTAFAAALLLAGAPATLQARTVRTPLVELTPQQMAGLGVRTAPLRASSARPLTSLPATFQPPPNARAAVTAPFAGTVTQVSVVEGQPVRRGQVLATVFSRDALNASADAAQAAAEATLAAQTQRRTALLVQEGIVAGAREQEADARLRSARAMLAAKSLSVRAAGADLRGRYTLRAPFTGRVANIAVQTGQGVEAMTAAFLVDRTDRIQAQANLPAALAGQVKVGDRVIADGAPGVVVAVGVAVDPKTRSLPLMAEVRPEPAFVPGRLGRIDILARSDGGQRIDRSALIRVDNRDVIFVKQAKGFALTPVKVLGYEGAQVDLKTGLPDGTEVAVAGVSQMKSALEK